MTGSVANTLLMLLSSDCVVEKLVFFQKGYWTEKDTNETLKDSSPSWLFFDQFDYPERTAVAWKNISQETMERLLREPLDASGSLLQCGRVKSRQSVQATRVSCIEHIIESCGIFTCACVSLVCATNIAGDGRKQSSGGLLDIRLPNSVMAILWYGKKAGAKTRGMKVASSP